jgi:hypothetical protein
MRAYMSDKTRGTHTQRGYAPPSWAGDKAIAEARAILADVEDRAMGMASHRPTRGDMGAAGCALRDCLALFLGQTFPGEVCRCAQGRHWSPERGYFDCGGIVPA